MLKQNVCGWGRSIFGWTVLTYHKNSKNWLTRQPALIFPTSQLQAGAMCTLRQPACLCLRFASCFATQQNATFLGVAHPSGGYGPQIKTRLKFLYNAPTPKFHHPMFTCLEVIVLTNTPTNKQRNRHRWKHPMLFTTLRHWVISKYKQEMSSAYVCTGGRRRAAARICWARQLQSTSDDIHDWNEPFRYRHKYTTQTLRAMTRGKL